MYCFCGSQRCDGLGVPPTGCPPPPWAPTGYPPRPPTGYPPLTLAQMLSSRYWEGAHVHEYAEDEASVFAPGQTVDARYRGRREWFHAMVVASLHGGAYFDLQCVTHHHTTKNAQGG